MSRLNRSRSGVIRGLWLSVGMASGLTAVRAEPLSLFPSLGRESVQLRFHLGGVRTNAPEIVPTLPDIPGPASHWYVAQWNKRIPLAPEHIRRQDASGADLGLGTPAFSFAAAGGESRLDIFLTPGRPAVFGLSASGGSLTSAGGSNLFLAVDAIDGGASLARPTTYQVKLKLTKAEVSAPNLNDLRNGTVLAQIFTGFTLTFTDPATGRTTPAFLQIHHADSRGVRPTHRQCSLTGDTPLLLMVGVLPEDRFAPFTAAPPKAALTPYSFDLTRHVCALVRAAFTCSGPAGATPFTLPPTASDLANWRIGAMYVGLETQHADGRAQGGGPPKGHVAVALQVSDPEVIQGEGAAPATCQSGTAP